MSGRFENEIKTYEKIEAWLQDKPSIIGEYYLNARGEQKSYTTINMYKNYIWDFVYYMYNGNTPEKFYQDVTSSDIKKYMIFLDGKGTKNSIKASRWSALNNFFTFLVLEGYIKENPMDKTKRPKAQMKEEVEYLGKRDMNRLFNNINKYARKSLYNRDVAVMSTFIATGIRISALLQLDVDDINFETNTIYLVEKGKKERYITFGENLKEKLMLWLDDRNKFDLKDNTNALFLTERGRRITKDSVEFMIKKYREGIEKNVTPHTLRRSAAMSMLTAGATIESVANRLGHNNISTTMRYVAATQEEKQRATDILDRLV